MDISPVLARILAVVAVMGFTTLAIGYVFVREYKSRKRGRLRRRRLRYTKVVAEVTATPDRLTEIVNRYRHDAEFVSVLIEFVSLLTGEQRRQLRQVAKSSGLVGRRIRLLHRGDVAERLQAARELEHLVSENDLAPLLVALKDDVAEVRVNVGLMLARTHQGSAVQAILAMMEVEEEWAVTRLADGLHLFGAAAVPQMAEYLTRRGTHSAIVARVLGRLGDLEAEPALIDSLGSNQADTRARAAAALATAGSPRALDPLLDALHDAQWEVRAQAAKTLGTTHEARAVAPLGYLLQDEAWWVRHYSAESLAKLPGGIDRLRMALNSDDQFAQEAAMGVLMAVLGPDRFDAGSGGANDEVADAALWELDAGSAG